MAVAWPDGVPPCIQRNSLRGGPVDVRDSFAPDRGVPIERPGATAAVHRYEITTIPLTPAAYAAFEAWFSGPLRFGAESFAFRHPLTDEVRLWRIAPGDQPYRIAQTAKRYVVVTFTALLLPGRAWFAPYLPVGTMLAPSVVIDPSELVFGMGMQRGRFQDVVDFSRASTADYVAEGGGAATAIEDDPCFDWTGGSRAWLLRDAAAPRARDFASLALPGGKEVWSRATIFVDAEFVAAGDLDRVFEIHGGLTSDRHYLRWTAAGMAYVCLKGGLAAAGLTGPAVGMGQRFRAAIAWAANDFALSMDGAAPLVDTLGVPPDVTTLHIGQNPSGSAQGSIRIHRLLAWGGQRMPNATLQAFTASP